jgi:hypothetical protein
MRGLFPLLIACLALTAFLAPAPSAHAAWVWPVAGKVITPYRNGTDPYATGQHRGIDIAAPVGARVVAAAGGEVRFAGTAGSSGLTISIRTGDGYDTSYLHLSSLAIRAGAHVSTGERIGAVGVTGVRSATAPHLHFGVRDAGTRYDYHDPLAFLPQPPAPHPPPAPSPAPAPAPAPAPPAAAPVIVPPPSPAPREAPHGAPARRPAPVPHRLPAPRSAPRARSAPSVVPSHLLVAEARRMSAVHPNGRPATGLDGLLRRQRGLTAARADRTREPQTAARSIGSSSGASLPSAATTPPHARLRGQGRDTRGSDGPDLAWAAACAGLLLAAALLGMGGEPQHRAALTTNRVRAALRPLIGGRG